MPFAGVAGPSYKVLFQVQKLWDGAVQAGSSESLFRVGSENR